MNGQWQPGTWRIYSEYCIRIDAENIYLGFKGFDSKITTLAPAKFNSGEAAKAPWLSGECGFSPKTFLQNMLDEAWERGLRPRAFADQEGTLRDTVNHLNDIRAIVSGKLKVVLP